MTIIRTDLHLLDAIAVAEEIRNMDYWDHDLCRRLCELAGLEDEWLSEGESHEAVLDKAAERLQVEIYD